MVPAELIPAVTFQGSGEGATENFRLLPGLAEFHFAHPADTPFAFFLLNLQGDHLALLANSTTAVTGTQVFSVKTAGEYHLHVIARDDWTVSVAQPGAQALAARATSITSLQGDAPSISAPMRLAAGPLRVAWTHRGVLAFELVLWHPDGRRAVEIVRTTGDAQGEKTITVPADGVYVLNITADGPWTVSLASQQ